MEDTGRGLPRKDDGGSGPIPLPSTPIGVAVQVSLTFPCKRRNQPGQNVFTADGLCCTNGVKDSLFESSMIAGGHEQLDPDEVQDHELVGLQ